MRGEKVQVRKEGKKGRHDPRNPPSGEREKKSQAGGSERCAQWRT